MPPPPRTIGWPRVDENVQVMETYDPAGEWYRNIYSFKPVPGEYTDWALNPLKSKNVTQPPINYLPFFLNNTNSWVILLPKLH